MEGQKWLVLNPRLDVWQSPSIEFISFLKTKFFANFILYFLKIIILLILEGA